MKKSFQFRIYPNRNQEVILNRTLSTCRHLYNASKISITASDIPDFRDGTGTIRSHIRNQGSLSNLKDSICQRSDVSKLSGIEKSKAESRLALSKSILTSGM